ncbi:MAG: hypothetical protein P8X67_06295 [Syntrophobacterales bacterium]
MIVKNSTLEKCSTNYNNVGLYRLNWYALAKILARIFHELLAATTDMAVLQSVRGFCTLRCTIQVRLGCEALRLPSGAPIFVVSRQQFMKYPG